MERAVRHTIAVKRATVGQLALQVYQFAKTFARKTERQVLMPHLDNMKRGEPLEDEGRSGTTGSAGRHAAAERDRGREEVRRMPCASISKQSSWPSEPSL